MVRLLLQDSPVAKTSARAPPKRLFSERLGETEQLPRNLLNQWRKRDRDSPRGLSYYGVGWQKFKTPLVGYAQGQLVEPMGEHPVADFLAYVNLLVEKNPSAKKLDVGVGGCRQWQEHSHNFYGTALTMDTVRPEMRKHITISTAGDIWKYFDPASFDLISTNAGAHAQIIGLIENAMKLLKIGGDVIISHLLYYEGFHSLLPLIKELDGKTFRILSSKDKNVFSGFDENLGTYYNTTIQLRKIAEP